jgi:hypothetical protein
MRTHAAPSCNLRPSLDLLEDRHLLSGGFEAIGVYPLAAIVVAIEVRDQAHVVELVGFPSGPQAFRGGSFSQMPPAARGSFDFAARDSLFAPDHGFQPPPENQSQLVSSNFQTPPEIQEPSTGTPIYWSMTGSSTASTSQESPPPGTPSPPGAPSLMPVPPPGAFLSGDFLKFKANEVFLREHGFEAKPLPEANAGNVEGNTTEGAQGGTAAISSGSQGVGALAAGNTIAQVAPPMTVAPAHLTALLSFETGRSDSLIQSVQINEAPGNQITEAGHGSLSDTSSTHLVSREAPATMAAAHLDENPPAPVPLTNGNQKEMPLPHAAGLVAGVLPFDRASLEQAVDQFFDRLEDLGVGQFVEQAPSRVLPLSLTVIGTVTAVEVARRRLRSKTGGGNSTRRQEALSSEELRGFPELPGSWSTRLT